jgi:hydrogenase maturation protein HypF
LAFDGTGYGEDGAIWGGEVLVADYMSYQRRFHLEYFPSPAGMRRSKNRLARRWPCSGRWVWNGMKAWLRLLNFAQKTSHNFTDPAGKKNQHADDLISMGRLFDAAAALAGVRQQVNYEGQAAIEFEALADRLRREISFELDQDQVRVEALSRR